MAIATAIFVALFYNTWSHAEQPVPVANVLPEVITSRLVPKSDIQFTKLSLAQGLSQTRVGQIIQDDDGYMWLGAQHGINRFDGYTFQVFKHDRDDPDSLSGVYIYSTFKDREGTIWIGTDQLLDAFDRKTGKFKHFVLDASTPTVLQISQDRSGILWLATSQGLYSLEPRTGAVKRFGQIPGRDDGLSTDDIKSTATDREGVFWVATGNGLEAFDPESGKVSLRIPLRIEAREFQFFEDSKGLFWILWGSGSGLALFDRASNTVKKISFSNADGVMSGIYKMIETRNGDLWLVSMGAGLLRFNRDDFTFDQYVNDPTDPQSLSENRAIEIYEDRQGNIWTGLHASPPNVFTPEPLPFQKVWPYSGHVNKLGETFVNAILEDRKGNVWLGTGGALTRIDPAGQLRIFDLAGNGTSVEILSMVEADDGTLWIGTIGTGLISFDPETGRTQTFRYERGRRDWISSDVVTRVFLDRQRVLWLATWNGLNRLDPKTLTFKTYRADTNLNKELFSIDEDDQNNLWIGSRVGLVKFSKTTEEFEEFRHDPSDPTTISNNTTNNVFHARDGHLWIATHNGLNTFDPATGKFKAYFEKDGLAGNAVSCTRQDSNGNLWISTNRGVSKMNPATASFQNFTSADGLPGNDMGGWHACSSGTEGRMYFAGFPGAAVVSPSRVRSAEALHNVQFTDVRIGDESVLYPLRDAGTEYRVRYDQNFAVSFSAFDFSNPAGVRYRYRIAPLETDWHILPAALRTINFATLPTGALTLVVEAAAERGDWEGSGSLAIQVSPPWWDTWWFITLICLLAIAAIAAVYKARMMQIEMLYNARLEERLGERTRVARDLHDTLLQSFQGLIYRLEAVRNLLPGEPVKASEMLNIILLKSDDAIVEGRDTIQSLRDPTKATTDILTLVEEDAAELASLQPDGVDARFSIKIEGKAPRLPVEIRDELRHICREALRNAYFHSGADNIECLFSFEGARMEIVVSDNGRGMPTGSDQTHYTGHYGIPGIRERAANLDAELSISSQEGKGTKVSLKMSTTESRLRSISRNLVAHDVR
ncbi:MULTISPECIES: sensor histidine kinase [unclassified Rhizobium]|uniref:sensor histidine kinase n=1 Tax=unclassified Rhizobium TaxID=2613769 RepID=UPI001AD9C87C|nr:MULTISPECIES: sensor histidine kinase [unclassified Rhizobium]MBO9127990.1 hypothetical protein [Rhizobium sp. 16-488-2b]MBO9178567.1 hypothetical protein [Rhizobium sp. 16-488-2a]